MAMLGDVEHGSVRQEYLLGPMRQEAVIVGRVFVAHLADLEYIGTSVPRSS